MPVSGVLSILACCSCVIQLLLQVRAARRLAQGRAKPIDWLVCDLYGLQQEEDHEGHNDDADDSEEEREHLRRQVRYRVWVVRACWVTMLQGQRFIVRVLLGIQAAAAVVGVGNAVKP
jgi:hypothetical protein